MKLSRSLSLICGYALTFSLPAYAEEGAKTALPQMDISQYPGELFWLAISFPLLYLLMRYVVLPPMTSTQKKRHEILSADIKGAEVSAAKAAGVMESYEKALREARVVAQDSVNEMAALAAKEANDRKVVLQKELNKRVAEAEASIAEVREAALRQTKDVVDDLARSIVAKVS